ncbi:hypothetical protein ARMGADRAFT_1037652 [Armillaria gallica]|uniref:Uncharacterized protein n=1 Tax=Armillaria gallica TaxID=47427 RepID=A0A2H3D8P4_ARMGA|nr:hypothetical protein ARMGADRAFT_1037652 [Armillaria gallica]
MVLGLQIDNLGIDCTVDVGVIGNIPSDTIVRPQITLQAKDGNISAHTGNKRSMLTEPTGGIGQMCQRIGVVIKELGAGLGDLNLDCCSFSAWAARICGDALPEQCGKRTLAAKATPVQRNEAASEAAKWVKKGATTTRTTNKSKSAQLVEALEKVKAITAAASASQEEPSEAIQELKKPKGEAGDKKRGFILWDAMGLEDDMAMYKEIMARVKTNAIKAGIDFKHEYKNQNKETLGMGTSNAQFRNCDEQHGPSLIGIFAVWTDIWWYQSIFES